MAAGMAIEYHFIKLINIMSTLHASEADHLKGFSNRNKFSV